MDHHHGCIMISLKLWKIIFILAKNFRFCYLLDEELDS